MLAAGQGQQWSPTSKGLEQALPCPEPQSTGASGSRCSCLCIQGGSSFPESGRAMWDPNRSGSIPIRYPADLRTPCWGSLRLFGVCSRLCEGVSSVVIGIKMVGSSSQDLSFHSFSSLLFTLWLSWTLPTPPVFFGVLDISIVRHQWLVLPGASENCLDRTSKEEHKAGLGHSRNICSLSHQKPYGTISSGP